MAWEKRHNGKFYYYESERGPDGKVRKRYLGCGIEAEEQAKKLQETQEQRSRERAHKAELTAVDRQLDLELSEILKIAGDHLGGKGMHNPKSRGWRHKRNP